ncbi:MAG: hypothetical protein IKK44_02945 [Clostridium sp.]|nr:hypothetical protein [Clostridium sp.]
MEWSKVKNIILVILAVTNVVLLSFVIHREIRDRSQQQQARADAILFLAGNGVSVDDSVIPQSIDLPMGQANRDLDEEWRLAAALLGEDVIVQSRGGEVYRYYSDVGWVQFHSDGAFQGEFAEGSFLLGDKDMAEHAAACLTRLGFTGQVMDSLSQGNDRGTVTLRQLWGTSPVFNLQATVEYEAGSLVRIAAGRRLFGQPVELSGSQQISVATALVRFMTGLDQMGDVCSRIDSIIPGYVSVASLTGTMTLTPVWYINTDTGGYQLDVTSGVLSRG